MYTGQDAFHIRNHSIKISEGEDAHSFKLRIFYYDTESDHCQYIGRIGIWKTRWDFYETHCGGLAYHEPNHGWGIELYYQMIMWAKKRNLTLKSSKINNGTFMITPSAIRVWESSRLRSSFKIHKKNGRYIIAGD